MTEGLSGQFLFINESQLREIIHDEVAKALTEVKERPRRMYNRFQARDIANVTVGTIDNWANLGYIKKIHLGRKVMFDADEFDKFIEKGFRRR